MFQVWAFRSRGQIFLRKNTISLIFVKRLYRGAYVGRLPLADGLFVSGALLGRRLRPPAAGSTSGYLMFRLRRTKGGVYLGVSLQVDRMFCGFGERVENRK